MQKTGDRGCAERGATQELAAAQLQWPTRHDALLLITVEPNIG
jgi:hypothetical protein